MKKILVASLAILILVSVSLSGQAHFTPYGSARIGYWYENEDEDWSGLPDGSFNMKYFLQGNSRFGARFKEGDKNGRIEFGGTGNIRLLWASYNMGSYTILIGQDGTMLTQTGTMGWNSDNNFVGWGAIDNSRRAQMRFDFDNGFAFALVQPQLTDIEVPGDHNYSQDKNILLPKVNFGYKGEIADNMTLHGAFGLNTYQYDDNAGNFDETVMSYVAGLLLDMKFDDIGIKLHGNYGQNTGNYGLGSQTYNKALWDAVNDEMINVITMGGFGELSYKMSSKTLLTMGASYTMSDSDMFEDTDSAMAAFGQIRYDIGNGFRISPEIGLLDRMENRNGQSQGSLLYFGTQLRMDF